MAILDAVESAVQRETPGLRSTGRSLALNSLENRVYEIEFEDGTKKVAKFYRPGRWSEEQLREEHGFLFALKKAEIPVVAPCRFRGESLFLSPDGIFFALFPKLRGRLTDELSDEQLKTLGRYLARIHAVGRSFPAEHRARLTTERMAREPLEFLLKSHWIDMTYERSYRNCVERVIAKAEPLLRRFPSQLVHGDCHLGNTLWDGESPFFLDFDDSMIAPPVQDVWMVITGRDDESLRQRGILLQAYETMLPFDYKSLALIEPLRALRLIHYSAWVARRWKDPSFPKVFPEFGTARYWSEEIQALEECLRE